MSGTIGPAAISVDEVLRLLFLQDYNTRVVVFGATCLGLAGGVIGSFTLLRRRALLGDALAHATLPGIALAFLLAEAAGFNGKSFAVLSLGATVAAMAGLGCVLGLRRWTHLRDDTALGIVLSVFFGAGMALMPLVQAGSGHQAGLESYILGQTAGMRADDATAILIAAVLAVTTAGLLFKELRLVCFDPAFGAAAGVSVRLVDWMLMGLVVLVTIVGLQAVGLVLMIALLVIPAAAARFWTHSMLRMTLLSGALGAASCYLGALLSASAPRLPSGAVIVLTASVFFSVSLVCGKAKGVLPRWLRRRRLNEKIDRQHVLRGLFEQLEHTIESTGASSPPAPGVPFQALLESRSWSARRLERALTAAHHDHLLHLNPRNEIFLSEAGLHEAERLVRQHRLWELYLIHYADVAPGRVDRGADDIEHVLEPALVRRLERLLDSSTTPPVSPHPLALSAGAALPVSEDGGSSDGEDAP